MRSIYKQKSIPATSIELIGSMGEPLSPSIAKWAKSYFGLLKSNVINTYFQTETGGIIMANKYNNPMILQMALSG